MQLWPCCGSMQKRPILGSSDPEDATQFFSSALVLMRGLVNAGPKAAERASELISARADSSTPDEAGQCTGPCNLQTETR
jgi:hypothetical protein